MNKVDIKIKEAEDRIMNYQFENGFSTIFDQLNEDLEVIRQEAKNLITDNSKQKVKQVSDEWQGKKNKYDEDFVLKNMEVGDWVLTYTGDIRKITMDSMPDLHYSEIKRYATKKEVNYLQYK